MKISDLVYKSGPIFALIAAVQCANAIPVVREDNPPPEMKDPAILNYQRHMLVVDSHGSALYPIVKAHLDKNGQHQYDVQLRRMEDEGTWDKTIARRDRRQLQTYLDGMFKEMEKENPKEVVIYIHGGLNQLTGAVKKSAYLTDYFREKESAKKIYYIGICWNSDLAPTYDEHLFRVREGLRQPMRAIISSPAALLADVGSALSRLPLRTIDLLYNDAESANPNGFIRHRLVEKRTEYLQHQESGPERDGTHVFAAPGERPLSGKIWDSTRWAVTLPTKVATLPIIDTLGVQPWKNMVRRTRTMFERESNFLPQPEGNEPEHDKLNYSARRGATRIFCEAASGYLSQLKQRGVVRRPTITLIGHSMGAIVAAEMLQRSHDIETQHALPFDNIVLMAAACSVNDFKTKISPYLSAPENKGTRLYNLCLNDNAERVEKYPGEIDLAPRGSLLVWIDTLFQEPESENDRTFGRWENAVLATDDIPNSVLKRMTLKEFGRDRLRNNVNYTVGDTPPAGRYILEPTHHGDFSHFDPKTASTNFAFWRDLYWRAESAGQ